MRASDVQSTCRRRGEPMPVRGVDEAVFTVNQLVAMNLVIARTLKGWKQVQAAEALEPYLGTRWSRASYSAAERSFTNPQRVRQFTADELVAFAAAFDVPVQFFFRPPSRGDATDVRVAMSGASAGLELH